MDKILLILLLGASIAVPRVRPSPIGSSSSSSETPQILEKNVTTAAAAATTATEKPSANTSVSSMKISPAGNSSETKNESSSPASVLPNSPTTGGPPRELAATIPIEATAKNASSANTGGDSHRKAREDNNPPLAGAIGAEKAADLNEIVRQSSKIVNQSQEDARGLLEKYVPEAARNSVSESAKQVVDNYAPKATKEDKRMSRFVYTLILFGMIGLIAAVVWFVMKMCACLFIKYIIFGVVIVLVVGFCLAEYFYADLMKK